MTAEEKIEQIMAKITDCPFCDGDGIDPIQEHHKGPEPAACRRCKGIGKINRLGKLPGPSGPVDAIILKEVILPNGTSCIHHQELTTFANKHRAILERPDPQLKMRDHLEEIKKGVDQIEKDCIDIWIAEGRV